MFKVFSDQPVQFNLAGYANPNEYIELGFKHDFDGVVRAKLRIVTGSTKDDTWKAYTCRIENGLLRMVEQPPGETAHMLFTVPDDSLIGEALVRLIEDLGNVPKKNTHEYWVTIDLHRLIQALKVQEASP